MDQRKIGAFTRRISQRLGTGPAPAASPIPEQTPILGNWEVPLDGVTVSAGSLTVSGWAFAEEPLADLNLRIVLDGQVVAWVKPQRPRPDVVEVFDDRGEMSGWSFDLYIDPTKSAAELEVVASCANGQHLSLGKRVVQVSSTTADNGLRTTGYIDAPVQDQIVTASVLNVLGWALIDSRPADKIEIYLNDQQLAPARRFIPRPDLFGSELSPVYAQCSGFSTVVPLRDIAPGSNARLEVRAISAQGKVWQPPPVVFTLADPDEPPTLLLASSGKSKSRPRVCVFTHSLAIGGGELYLQELLYRLAELDFADFILVCAEDGPLRAGLEAVGVEVHILAMSIDRRRHSDRVARTRAVLEAWQCDVVLVNTLGESSRVEGANEIGLPVVWIIHESFDLDVFHYVSTGSTSAAPEVSERQLNALRNAALLVFVAEATRQMFLDRVPEARSRRIPYGIDLAAIAAYEGGHLRKGIRAELGFSERDRVVLCIGIVQERKAQLALMYAFAEIKASHPNVKLVIVGWNPSVYGFAVKRWANDLELGDDVRIVDVDPDTFRWYHAADIVVSASDVESLPRSFLESMAFGTPVVAADVYGVSEVVSDGINGWLFEANDGSALKEGLARAVGCSAAELKRMSDKCREDARQFDGRGYASEFRTLILELSDKTRTPLDATEFTAAARELAAD